MATGKKNSITVQYALADTALPTRGDFSRWVDSVLHNQQRHAEVCIRVVDFAESAALNAQYRKKNTATNVLSFRADLPAVVQSYFIGDLVICAPQVALEATQQGKYIKDHWAHLVIHGILHLLGYQHDTSAEAGIMESFEIRLLAQLGVSNPYLETQAAMCLQQ